MSQVSEQENKGQYCQFVQTADGSYILKPVKVPAHIKAERAERIRQRDSPTRRRKQEKSAGDYAGLSSVYGTDTGSVCRYLLFVSESAESGESSPGYHCGSADAGGAVF